MNPLNWYRWLRAQLYFLIVDHFERKKLRAVAESDAEIVRAEDALKPRVVIRDGKKKPAPKKPPKHFTTRQRYSLTRLDVRDLLDKPGVAEALPINQEYRALADRNISIEDLAEKHH